MGDRTVVLGYSGLHGSEAFRRRWLGEDADPADLRTFQGQDSAAALIIGGKLVAAVQEERFSGRKFDGELPANAIEWCLERGNVEPADVSVVAHNFDYGGMGRLFAASPLDRALFESVYAPEVQASHFAARFPGFRVPVTPVRHHVAHAFSGASAAAIDEAAVLVVDGLGEIDAVSTFRWADGRMQRLRTSGPASSIGIFYSVVTQHLGFLPASDEYKVMGLAPFGDPNRFAAVAEEAIQLTPRGVNVPVLDWTDGQHRYLRTFEWLESATFPRRPEESELSDEHADLAASVQHRVTEALLHLADQAVDLASSCRLIMVGGVALNCSAVGQISRQRDLEILFVPPAPGDDGSAVGAAVAASHVDGLAAWPRLPLLGPEPVWTTVRNPDRTFDDEDLVSAVVDLLVSGAIVGWAQGALEFGPRALGSRSVFADPTSTELRDRVNLIVKSREAFRPLAPVVLAGDVGDWFDVPAGTNVRHMTAALPVRPERRDRIAGVVHADGTARLQSLSPDDLPLVASIVAGFKERTGIPMLLNTSLNLRGQPIARTGNDAMLVFEGSDLDALVVGRDMWVKPHWHHVLADRSAPGRHRAS